MGDSPLPGISGIPTLPRNKVPKVIGTEVCFIADGKIFTGLIRSSSENELILQCGTATTRTIKYNQVIGINECNTFCNNFELKVTVSIYTDLNRTLINCVSAAVNNINGVMFYSITSNKEEKDWSKYENTYAMKIAMINAKNICDRHPK